MRYRNPASGKKKLGGVKRRTRGRKSGESSIDQKKRKTRVRVYPKRSEKEIKERGGEKISGKKKTSKKPNPVAGGKGVPGVATGGTNQTRGGVAQSLIGKAPETIQGTAAKHAITDSAEKGEVGKRN